MTEAELIERARGGDREAFTSLVQAHSERVYRALRGFSLTAEEAEEVSQEVFVRAWRGLGRFEARAQFSTWLYRIAFNEAQRRLSRRPPQAANPGLEGEEAVSGVPEAPGHGPAARALDQELQVMIWQALQDLPEQWRTAVVLRDVEGLSTEEAAAVAGVRPAAFKSRLHRGRMQLRSLLEPYLEQDIG